MISDKGIVSKRSIDRLKFIGNSVILWKQCNEWEWVCQWRIRFKNGRTNVHHEEKSGRPSFVKDELVANVIEEIRENHSFTTELLLCFPQIPGFLSHEIVTQKMDYHKFRARWAPKVLTEVFKSQCMAALSNFLGSCEKNGYYSLIILRLKSKYVLNI